MITKDDLVKLRDVMSLAGAAYDAVIADKTRRDTAGMVDQDIAKEAAMDEYVKAKVVYDKALRAFLKQAEVLPAPQTVLGMMEAAR